MKWKKEVKAVGEEKEVKEGETLLQVTEEEWDRWETTGEGKEGNLRKT